MELERLTVRDRGAAAGFAAGTTVALAAATVAGAMYGSSWELAPAVRAQALSLSARAQRLASENADAFAAAEQALTSAGSSPGALSPGGLGSALGTAAELPRAMAQAAADIAALAADAASHVEPARRPDLAAAALLAAGAANASAHLVVVNLAVGLADPRRATASRTVARAMAAAERAVGAQE